ncbi:hypothetical protein SMICM304S_11759 [Streptomyces microflavus]
MPLLANVGGQGDVPAAVEAGAEGVGLFNEFLFLDDSKQAPSEEKQIAAYRAVLEAFPEGRVVVRVLDAGADKPLDFLTPADEPNPALGVRGLRSLLDHPDVLRTQLTALAKAAEGLPGVPGGDRRRWPTASTPRRSRNLLHEAGLFAGEVRCDGGDCSPPLGRGGDPAGGRVPVAGHQRPGAVHLRRRPSGGRGVAAPGPVAARAARPGGAVRGGRSCRGQELWCVRGGRRGSAAGLCCTGLGVTSLSIGARCSCLCARHAGQVHAGPVRACGERSPFGHSAEEARNAAQAVLSGE